MFGDPLDDLIRQQVKEEARIHLDGENDLNAIWDALMLALEAWKQQHGDRKPIDGSTIGGLLGGNPKRIPFAKAKPWQCTGSPFETVTSLTLRLLHEKFPAVAMVSKAATEKKLMAALLIKAGDSALSDWFHAYRRMLWAQIPDARKAGAYSVLLENWDTLKAGKKQKQILDANRHLGPEAQKSKAAENEKLILEENSRLLSVTPRSTLDDRADILVGWCKSKGITQINKRPYKFSTIYRMITGKR